MSKSTRFTAASVLMATFVIGCLTGAGVAILLGPRPPDFPQPPIDLAELDLTAQQMEQVQELHERHRPELEQILRDTFPKARAIQEKIEGEVRALLTPPQQKEFDELKSRRPPGPPMPPNGAPPLGPPPF